MFKKDEIKVISIFGVTGSVGMSTQELIKLNIKKFKVDTIVANNDVNGLIKAAKYLKPNLVIINNDKMGKKYFKMYVRDFDGNIIGVGIGSSKQNITELLQQYKDIGVTRLVALRGDIPSGMVSTGDFMYANELIEFIRSTTGDYFTIEVACYPEFHPQSPDAHSDLLNFKRKLDCGADSAITQYF